MKKLKILLIFLIVINVVILIGLLVTPGVYQYENYTEYVLAQGSTISEEDKAKYEKANKTMALENETEILKNYTGDLATGLVNNKLSDLINGGFEKFYTDTEGMNKSTLAKYFDTNKDTIAMQTGLTTAEDFANFIKKIQIYQDKDISCEKVAVVEGSFAEAEDDYSRFDVKLSYDNEQELDFTVYLSNSDFRDTPIVVIK